MNFRDLQCSLLQLARHRIRNGTVTERGLARLSGVSQPHVHNSLKNTRRLSFEATDRIMAALNLTIGDLLGAPASHATPAGHSSPSGHSNDEESTFTPVPFLRARVGPGSQPVFDAFRGFLPVASSLASGLVLPVAARLAPDPVLPRACAAGDIVLLDQNPDARACPVAGLWIVADGAFGMRVRYVRLIDSRLFVFHEANAADPALWGAVPLEGRNITDIVRARLVWIGREMEKPAPEPFDPSYSASHLAAHFDITLDRTSTLVRPVKEGP